MIRALSLLLSILALAGCSSGDDSAAWCRNVEEKPDHQITQDESDTYKRLCVLKSLEIEHSG